MIGPPPSGGEGYVEITVRFAAAEGRVDARVETPAGDSEQQPVALRVPGDEAEELAHRALLDACVPGRGDEPARRLGQALFTALFHGPALERYRAALGPARTVAPPLRLRFHLATGSAVERALHRLPWELLCEPGPGGGRLLALDRRLSVVRHLTIGDGVSKMARPPRLRVLVAAAEGRAPGAPPLDLGGEVAAIRAGCPPGGDVAVEVLRPATLDALIERLRAGRFHVLHLIGHGELGGGDGVILLPDTGGRLVPCRGEQLAVQLGGLSPLRLVVLNACRTAEAVAERPFAGVATALLRHGLPAAVAMQAPITDGAAARFAAVLFARLAAGASLDAAVAEGRLAISWWRPRTFEWAVPVLFSRLPGGELFAAPEGLGAAPSGGGEARAPVRRWSRSRQAPVAAAGAVLVLAALVAVPAAIEQRGQERREDVAAEEGRDRSGELDGGGLAGESSRSVGPPRDVSGEDASSGDGAAPVERGAVAQPDELLGPLARLPVDAPPRQPDPGDRQPPGTGRLDPTLESIFQSSEKWESEVAEAAPDCGETPRVLRSGESAYLAELQSHLQPHVLEWPGLDTYVTLSLHGGFRWRETRNHPTDVDFRPHAPLVVSLLDFDPAAGTVRLACRIVSQPP